VKAKGGLVLPSRGATKKESTIEKKQEAVKCARVTEWGVKRPEKGAFT